MKQIVVLSGAGISVESGLSTFRDNGGLWDKYPIEEVATIQAWNNNPQKVTDFYNLRRDNCVNAEPNMAHILIGQLEERFSVKIITQNIDDLHERGGSSDILHLHGEIMLARSCGTGDTYPIKRGENIKYGDKCPKGFLLRPDVVWFGESVPNLVIASEIVKKADFLIIIGTSLQVYPAAGLIYDAPINCKKFVIDPNELSLPNDFVHIKKPGTKGMNDVIKLLE
tara:strand:- start:307 stop:981 length:675 start_codon:yes stop_codon:yes gene_type:complete